MMDRSLQIRVPPREVTPERLDTGYYSAEYFRARMAIDGSGISSPLIGDVSDPWCFGAYALCNEIQWARAENGIPYLKAESLGTPLLNEDALSFVTPETHRLLEKSRLIRGDVIVSTSGTVGLCAVIPEHIPEANSNQDTIKFRLPSQDFDSSFVAAWLSCRIAQAIMRREAGGAVQHHIYLYNFKRLPLLKPSRTVQRYIGDKVRLAGHFVRQSQCDINGARGRIEELLLGESQAPSKPAPKDEKHQRVSSGMVSDRIDGWYYKPEFLRIEAALNRVSDTGLQLIPVHQIGDVEYGFMPTEDYWSRNEGAPLLRVTNIKENLVVDTSDLEYVNPVLSDKPRYRLRSGDVLCVQCGNSTGRIAYITSKFHNMVFPSFSLRVTNVGSDWDSAFLACFFASTVGQAQIQRTISITSVRPNTTKPAIEAVQVPKFSFDEQKRIGDAVRRGVTLREFVDPLCNAAKFLVEALIERKISEGDVETAQKALEGGDTSLDREILKRLTVVGIDVASEPPLFTDIDALYSAIQETKSALPSNGDTA